MWVNIEKVSDSEEIIYLPPKMAYKFNEEIVISFGKKNAIALVEPIGSLKMDGGDSFDNPLRIRFSNRLISRLNIPDNLTYQIKYNSAKMIIGPTIGLLLGGHNYLYSPDHMEKYSDRFGVYEKVGGLIYAFSHKSIDWENNTVYGLYYDNNNSKWEYSKLPFPSVIYRRDFHTDPEVEEKLVKVTKGKMFNSWRFTKFFLYEHVKKDKELLKHLPDTELSQNYEQIADFIERNNDIILKPTDLSRGRGICIINKVGESYKIFDYRNREVIEKEIADEKDLENFFDNNKEFFDKYLIQQHLKLAKVDESPFDIRVVMQKETLDEWKCSGIECRVAAKKTLVTNISRGGYALTIDQALRGAFSEKEEEEIEEMKEQVNLLCLNLCKNLEKTGHQFAELGMDIAVDEDGHLWIIEVNVFPSFKGFKTMDYETYLNIRHTPILYAAHLAGFGINTSKGKR